MDAACDRASSTRDFQDFNKVRARSISSAPSPGVALKTSDSENDIF